MTDADLDPLHDHGDRQVPAGTVDLAVNVLPTPDWLVAELGTVDVRRYPDPAPALDAIAQRHGTEHDTCLVLHGAAEAFWLLALALRPRLAACVHPSFTAPEAALRACGVPVRRVLRAEGTDFALDPARVPEDADLVVLGRPDNPTGRLDPVEVVAALARPGRVIVVDEAFADFLPDAAGLHGSGIPGLVCVRSLTKLWGLAGLRVGYLLGPAPLLAKLDALRQPWPVGSPALHAARLVVAAEDERRRRAEAVAADRAALVEALRPLPVTVWPSPANFVLLRTDQPDLRRRLLDRGIAVRRGRTFPGLDRHHVRVTVPADPDARRGLVSALAESLAAGPPADVRPEPAPASAHRPTDPPGRTLVLGGARSGKSRHAQRLLADHDDVLYVAPGPVPAGEDPDWSARIAAHRRSRPATWTTWETADVAGALETADRPVLLDCLATWLSRTMGEVGAWDAVAGDTGWEERLEAEVERLLGAWRAARVPVVAVSNEVGSGVVPGTRSGVLFRDALGRLNQRIADESDDVRLVVAGRVQRLEGERA